MRYFPQKCDYIYEAKQKNAKGSLRLQKQYLQREEDEEFLKLFVLFLLKKTMHMQRRSLRLSLVYQSEGGEVFVYTLDRILTSRFFGRKADKMVSDGNIDICRTKAAVISA